MRTARAEAGSAPGRSQSWENGVCCQTVAQRRLLGAVLSSASQTRRAGPSRPGAASGCTAPPRVRPGRANAKGGIGARAQLMAGELPPQPPAAAEHGAAAVRPGRGGAGPRRASQGGNAAASCPGPARAAGAGPCAHCSHGPARPRGDSPRPCRAVRRCRRPLSAGRPGGARPARAAPCPAPASPCPARPGGRWPSTPRPALPRPAPSARAAAAVGLAAGAAGREAQPTPLGAGGPMGGRGGAAAANPRGRCVSGCGAPRGGGAGGGRTAHKGAASSPPPCRGP